MLNNYNYKLKLKKHKYNTNRLKPIYVYLNYKLYNKKNYFTKYKKLFYINYFNKLLIWNLFCFIHILNISEFLLFYVYFNQKFNIYIYLNIHQFDLINYINNLYKYYYYIYIININKMGLVNLE